MAETVHRWFAIASPGLEEVLALELGELGLGPVLVEAGGVSFNGGLQAGYTANLGSRIATRVLLRLGEVKARKFAALRRALSALPYERFLSGADPVRVEAKARRCRLYHTGALAETLQLAIGDRLGAPLPAEPAQRELPFGREPFARLLLRGEEDHFTLSVDSSGLLLHQRGARAETGRAPLRETLAAGVLRLAGYRGDEPLVNAMCGAGTLAIEAAELARGVLPGRRRHFAFEAFPCFDAARYATHRRAALSQAGHGAWQTPIHAYDRDRAAIARARRNLRRAGLQDAVELAVADARTHRPPFARGLLIANPPYGRRLSAPRAASSLLAAFAAQLGRHFGGYRVALLVPRSARVRLEGVAIAQRIALQNGGLPVQLLIGRCDGGARGAASDGARGEICGTTST